MMQSIQMINGLIFLTTGLYLTRGSTVLSPSPAKAAEGEPFNLTCAYSGNETVTGFIWTLNGTIVAVLQVPPACTPFDKPGPPNSSLYEYSCPDNKSSAFTVKQISNDNNGDQWKCAASLPLYNYSNGVTITVLVAVKSVSLTPPTALTESVESLFKCETSASRPVAAVSWYKESSTGQKQQLTNNILTTSVDVGSLEKAISELKLTPSRNDIGANISCTAINIPGRTPVKSAAFTLNVRYAPDSPPKIEHYSNTYKIIENRQGSLSCTIQGGNPPALLTWNCYNTGSAEVIVGTNVTKTVTWTALRDQDRSCTCQSSHPLTETQSVSVSVQVLYPPSTPEFSIKSTSVLRTITVIKNNPVSISCSSSGKPNQIQYTWTSNSETTSGSVLMIERVLGNTSSRYTCDVQNSMAPSDGNVVTGKNSSFINIEVQYPPEVGKLQNQSIAEGKSLTVTCPFTVGNPLETSFKWNRTSDDREWTTQDLIIKNVSRNDAVFYTCEVANMMKQTGEEHVVTIPDSESFYLNVWYGATVTDFYVNGFVGETNVTVNESGTVPFICIVDSNPGSDITVQYPADGKHSTSDTDTNSFEYILENATCLDAGIYMCTGANQYTTKPSVKQLRLFVNCSPRQSPFIELIEKVTSALHEEAQISFTTLAYPEPANNDFRWFRWDNVQWISLSNNAAYQIHTGQLQSNLTVTDVNRTSYGKYKLNVKNSVGDYEQIFHLVPAGKPEEPTDVQHVQNLVTETTFTIQWKPGFDNGLEQVFILKYRKASDPEWKSVEIPDSGELLLKYTVSDLSSGTNYEVVLFASNKLGNSSESAILKVTTKASEDTSDIGPLVGGAVGGSVALTLVVVLGFLWIKKIRFSKGKSKSEVELSRRQMDDQDDESSEDEVITENAMYESAGGVGRQNLVDNSVYAKPQKKVKTNQDVYAVVSKAKKYGPKKLQKDKSNRKDIGDIYENAPDLSASKDKTYANRAYEDSPYEGANTVKSSKHEKKNADGLIYADLAFNDQPKGQKKLVIHGLDSMTEYVQVDFTKKAEPLPDSDTEDQK